MNTQQIREYVVRPTLQRLTNVVPYTQAAENLVFGTGLVESAYGAIDQGAPGPGPAYGFWQMENPTYTDLWNNFIRGRPALRDLLLAMSSGGIYQPVTELHGNLFYAAAMCRVQYMRASAPLPIAIDVAGMAAYWKQYYNTPLGAGTIERATPFFQQAVTT